MFAFVVLVTLIVSFTTNFSSDTEFARHRYLFFLFTNFTFSGPFLASTPHLSLEKKKNYKKTWPNWNGAYEGAADAILSVIDLKLGEGYQKGATKIFIRAPESVFTLEELRERKVFGYANTIQRFFQTFSLGTYYYNIQMAGNQKLKGQKGFFPASFF